MNKRAGSQVQLIDKSGGARLFALLFILSAGTSWGQVYTATIGGNGFFVAGGWTSYNVVDKGTISFDLSAPQRVRIDTVVTMSKLSCMVGKLGKGCIMSRTELIRIDGELAFDANHYYFSNVDQYLVTGEDPNHDPTPTYICERVPMTPNVSRDDEEERIETSCVAPLPSGHHTLDLAVSSGLGNAFDTKPQNFKETVQATVTVGGGECGRSTLQQSYPTMASPALIQSDGGWKLWYGVTDRRGLELKDIWLGDRYLAASFSIPYFQIQTSSLPKARCNLTPDSDLTQEHPCESRLIALESHGNNANPLEVKATYEVDHLPYNSSASCAFITQDYQFYEPKFPGTGTQGCEPTSSLPCSIIKPLVSYRFVSPDQFDTLTSIEIPQRLHFAVDDQGLSGQSEIFTQDEDSPPPPHVILVGDTDTKIGASDARPAFYARELNEFEAVAIQGASPDGASTVDNYHQTAKPYVQLPYPPPGCPECIHIHWRWSEVVAIAGGPQFGGGRPIVPDGSNQSVKVAVVRYYPNELEPLYFEDLVEGESLVGWPAVFWYDATGYQQSDTFFTHGAFFSPTSSSPVRLNLSVVRAVQLGNEIDIDVRLSNSGTGPADTVFVSHVSANPISSAFDFLNLQQSIPILLGTINAGTSDDLHLTFNSSSSSAMNLVLTLTMTMTDQFGIPYTQTLQRAILLRSVTHQ